jgi:hypothetical protein
MTKTECGFELLQDNELENLNGGVILPFLLYVAIAAIVYGIGEAVVERS